MRGSAIYLLLAFVVTGALLGCKGDQVAHNTSVLTKETSEQSKLKDRLKNMTPEEREAELRNNPQARALLMPGGMGNPANRMGQMPGGQGGPATGSNTAVSP